MPVHVGKRFSDGGRYLRAAARLLVIFASPREMSRSYIALPLLLGALACREGNVRPPAPATPPSPLASPTGAAPPATSALPGPTAAVGGEIAQVDPVVGNARTPNELGRIPILEYHLIGDKDGRWMVAREHFRRQLQLLYERGYRPISVAELVDRKIDLPAGQSPVVFTFDDASPGQFSYIERDGVLEIDPGSALGIWLDFHRAHPDWRNRAVFCVLPSAAAGHAFFGDKGIGGQATAWRLRKVRYLAEQGFELCNHTLWHANLAKYSDAMVQEQIARGALAIDSAVPGYRVRTFALPLGVWPRNRELARAGAWRDPHTGRVIRYEFDAVLEVSGGPARSPYDPRFDPHRLPRVEVFGNRLETLLDQLERSGARYVSDGNAAVVARAEVTAGLVGRQ